MITVAVASFFVGAAVALVTWMVVQRRARIARDVREAHALAVRASFIVRSPSIYEVFDIEIGDEPERGVEVEVMVGYDEEALDTAVMDAMEQAVGIFCDGSVIDEIGDS